MVHAFFPDVFSGVHCQEAGSGAAALPVEAVVFVFAKGRRGAEMVGLDTSSEALFWAAVSGSVLVLRR